MYLPGRLEVQGHAPDGAVHADLYQLFSYLVASDLPGRVLVYGQAASRLCIGWRYVGSRARWTPG